MDIHANSPFASSWFALQTRYRYEERIASELKAKGFESYLPTLRETHQWKDRKKVMDVPAFGGYIFARFEPSLQNRVRVLETAGVVKLLGNHGRPEPVPESEISSLRLALTSGAECDRHPCVEIGTPVKVRSGMLAGVEGRVVRIANQVKILVNISSVCQAIAVEVHLDDIDLLETSNATPAALVN
ncbi:UpxY family transcription antiterminator [Silvibacterium dinghuense]|uniref:UpxY family transcription antiterminator n=1 Tax=Silvibacterium dinghuense TaxID=1560006 RepID=A0A4Q1SH97_9BACT|nr:UpxY family transcription antiterminator [Silvibacterium dinghuense]RXS96749.1 UpxY family transcription antiterminator [Silvibacterium dinghuense]GGG93334.1 transcription termination factor NusG domain protein [Silvibacterium dinghuense]